MRAQLSGHLLCSRAAPQLPAWATQPRASCWIAEWVLGSCQGSWRAANQPRAFSCCLWCAALPWLNQNHCTTAQLQKQIQTWNTALRGISQQNTVLTAPRSWFPQPWLLWDLNITCSDNISPTDSKSPWNMKEEGFVLAMQMLTNCACHSTTEQPDVCWASLVKAASCRGAALVLTYPTEAWKKGGKIVLV